VFAYSCRAGRPRDGNARDGGVAKPVRAADAGDGVYHADIQLTKATHWTFVVDIAAAQTRTHVTRDLDVR
jgi:hypothetical protein